MSRWGKTFPKDTQTSEDGDSGFTGVNARTPIELLSNGWVHDAVNMTFKNGVAQTREGMITPVSHRLAGEFALNGFVLFLCLDETGSIGIGGAERGLEIIAAFRDGVGDQQIRGIGYVSFGNIICETYPITSDLDAVVARLTTVVNSGGSDAVFFQDSGGDTPENGVDALKVAFDQLKASAIAQAAQYRYVFLKTDTAGYAHSNDNTLSGHAAYESAVAARVSEISRLFIEFDAGNTANGDPSTDLDTSGDWGEYADLLPESEKIVWDDFDPSDPPAVQSPVTNVYGSGLFSDPNGVEWLMVASNAGVHLLRDGTTPRLIATPEVITTPCQLVQAFNNVLLFRSKAVSTDKFTPWEWDGTRGGAFTAIDTTDHSDGTSAIPNGADRFGLLPVVMQNRLLMPDGRDVVDASDVLDYTRYDQVLNAFRINEGSEDVLTALYPFTATDCLAFKSRSTYVISNVTGDLSGASLQEINRELGCVAGLTARAVGADVFFLSATGVYRVQQIIQDRLQTGAVAVSSPIQPIIERINWLAANRAVAAVLGDYYYLAVPLDGATVNNAILPYNTVNDAWEGVWEFPAGVQIDALHTTDWNGERQLYAVDYASMRVHLLNYGHADRIEETEHAIASSLVTRGYRFGSSAFKQFRRIRETIATYAPTLTMTLRTDGVNETSVLSDGLTKSRTTYQLFGQADYDPTNGNDDHATPLRQDYSVALPVRFKSGLRCFERQTSVETQHTRARGRWASLEVANTTGFVAVAEISIEADETDRNERSKV